MSEPLFHLAFIGPGGPEFLIVMLVLLLLFGAKDAPRIFRKINEMINSVRNTAEGFKREIMYSDLDTDTSAADPVPYDAEDEHDEHDDDYDYDEYENDYSDETFDNLEQDLEDAGVEPAEQSPDLVTEPAPEPEVTEEEDSDAKKA